MPPDSDIIQHPELIIGVAGPIGVDVDSLTATLAGALREVGYRSVEIKVTSEMLRFPADVPKPTPSNFHTEISYKMDYANALCRANRDGAALARIGIAAIKRERSAIAGGETVPERIAYIVRQFKRPQEINLLRKIYGKQFILVSSYGPVEERKKLLEEKLKRSLPTRTPEYEISQFADQLIHRDANERVGDFGQQLSETFHLADVFVDGIDRIAMNAKIGRFIDALFGRNDIAPSKHEYGMYAAKSASLRSSDLSRQVGAAIFSDQGELVTQGCNEVPKALGGTYWDLEEPDWRDVRLRQDPNDIAKKEIVRDLFERLIEAGWLSNVATKHGSASQIVEAAIQKRSDPGTLISKSKGPLSDASILDLTEYGRVVHAEMCAICDAARLGRSLKGGILFCTTFPCHNCTKHIIASGIRMVIYMEPYPKSRAKQLHEHEIEIEKVDDKKVSFVPFLGISPLRYRDIFQKGRRKGASGSAQHWYAGEPRPVIDILYPYYTSVEEQEIARLFERKEALFADLDDQNPRQDGEPNDLDPNGRKK